MNAKIAKINSTRKFVGLQYFLQADGGQRCYGTFIFSFLVESDLKFTESEAANLNSLFWGCFTLGRMSGIPIARFVPTPVMIAIQGLGLVVTCVILAIFVFYSKVVECRETKRIFNLYSYV